MFKVLNIEQQNKEPRNHEGVTSIFPPEADSVFCGLKIRNPQLSFGLLPFGRAPGFAIQNYQSAYCLVLDS